MRRLVDDATAAHLAALRIEYAAAQLELDNARAEARGRNALIEEMADRAQRLYLAVYDIETYLTEDKT